MSSLTPETNRRTWATPEIAAHYASLDYLTPCERLLFETYIRPGSAVLDLGVGGGRTTAYLASRASRYVGVDYAPEMIKACRTRFPGLEFVEADAANLSMIPEASFDAVVFAYNGIDSVLPDQARIACLTHIQRILKAGGMLIFSSHNARAVLVRPGWNHNRLARMARRVSAGSKLLSRMILALLTFVRSVLALGQAIGASLPRLFQRMPTRAFWSGTGCFADSAHGGLLTHCCIPDRAVGEVGALGFQACRILGDDYPRPSHRFATDWYYCVFVKPGRL
ncbi:MAG TPA: class I SAM-dependent methyltransferase [Candidatus Sulfotelmatobacter sp.]|nr:class I SAM-dependent methyltransferase [Candidatus Sulfotelmatobacter sp.]